MKNLIISLSSCFILLLTGCKKNNTPKDEISFTYNGKDYHYSSRNSIKPEVDVRNGFYRTPSVEITIPGFDGKIIFEKTGCAYYLPKLVSQTILPGCVISYSSLSYNTPIDSSKIYQYSSGTLNLSSTNCRSSSFVVLGITLYSTYCDVDGTFDLTLTNSNNEKIVITNGIVRLHSESM